MTTYADLLKIQAEDLAKWKAKLIPEVYAPIEALVLSQNLELLPRAPGKRQGSEYPHPTSVAHSMRVWRGWDIVEIVHQWPNLREPYKVEDDCI